MDLGQPTFSTKARGPKNNVQRITSSEARGLRDLGQPITSSEMTGSRNLRQPLNSSEEEAQGILINQSPRATHKTINLFHRQYQFYRPVSSKFFSKSGLFRAEPEIFPNTFSPSPVGPAISSPSPVLCRPLLPIEYFSNNI